jgi:hypothetical protein
MGYSDIVNPGDNPKLSSDLLNVHCRFGRIIGRGGMTKFGAISTASSAAIIGLFDYRQADGSHELVRMLPTALEHYTGGVWAVVTGTALTGSATTRPQYTIIDDYLVFTNEGEDLPRKFNASGNSAPIASSLSPYGRGLIAYYGYLFIFNVSDDGTFTDVVDGPRIGRFSDDWDNDWAACAGNEITLDETPGSWLSSLVVAKAQVALKSDGAVRVRWVGGNQIFTQELIPGAEGIVAPLSSAGTTDNAMGFYLGNDGIIYQVTEQSVQPISYESLFELIPNTASLNKLKYARGLIDSKADSYVLFYDRTGLSNQLLDSYVEYNYRTKEWVKGALGPQVIACASYKPTDQAAEVKLVSTTTLVEEFDSSATDDDGTAISRYWTSGWQQIAEEGWLSGVRIVCKKNKAARIRVSVALNFEDTFKYPQWFWLKGGSVNDDHVELTYRLAPQLVEWVNVKIQFMHDSTAAETSMRRTGFEVIPLLKTGEIADRGVLDSQRS